MLLSEAVLLLDFSWILEHMYGILWVPIDTRGGYLHERKHGIGDEYIGAS